MSQSAEVSNGDAAAAVELVTTDSVLNRWGEQSRAGFQPSLEGLEWSAPIDRSMWSLLVVVRAEGVELELKMSEALGGSLRRERSANGHRSGSRPRRRRRRPGANGSSPPATARWVARPGSGSRRTSGACAAAARAGRWA